MSTRASGPLDRSLLGKLGLHVGDHKEDPTPSTPTPCLRCGTSEPLPLGVSIDEIYLYRATLTLERDRLDIRTGDPDGRLCVKCTELARAFLAGGAT